jgi:hypothetical protein
MDLIKTIFTQLDIELARITDERRAQDLPGLRALEVKVLGQMSLIMDPAGRSLNLAATRDLDALILGDSLATEALRGILKSNGMIYDELSMEVWLPDLAYFMPYHSTPNLVVSYLDPLSALTSKAVKAKEKNRFLIREALSIFGNSLEEAILRYGGEIDYFKHGDSEL